MSLNRRSFLKALGSGVAVAIISPLAIIQKPKAPQLRIGRYENVRFVETTQDISPKTAGHAIKRLLKMGKSGMTLNGFGQGRHFGRRNNVVNFRRYKSLR